MNLVTSKQSQQKSSKRSKSIHSIHAISYKDLCVKKLIKHKNIATAHFTRTG
uniref:Uncharacterized protein n=1 Tax=Rhizophora mucronata TaxID=61149 RepID=A0A2P2JWG4_RHIMU